MMKPRFTLVPTEFFSEESARTTLSKVVPLENGEPLSSIAVEPVDAVMIYASGERPIAYEMLLSLFKIRDHNKILFHYSPSDGVLTLVISQGDSLQLCNCFDAPDFTTAQYYIFSALKKLQINPEVSTIFSYSQMTPSQIISLCSYFKNADSLL